MEDGIHEQSIQKGRTDIARPFNSNVFFFNQLPLEKNELGLGGRNEKGKESEEGNM
jgi:hypothetical protein